MKSMAGVTAEVRVKSPGQILRSPGRGGAAVRPATKVGLMSFNTFDFW